MGKKISFFRKPLSSRRAQAATEYLHTYGWIFLSAVVIGGVLLYFNVSRADYLVPKECKFLSGIRCIDVVVDESLLSIAVINEFGFAAGNISVSIEGTCNSTANTTDGNPYGNLNVILANKQTIYFFECQNLTNMNVYEVLLMNYTNVESGQRHFKKGKLQYSSTG
jgi:hypothetical protein